MRHLILVILLLPIFYGVGLFVASEYGGEVVELDTYDARGNRFTTPLWVVDLHGEPWLRAGDPESAWLQRMRRNPEVEVHLKRDGQRTAYLAEIVDTVRRFAPARMEWWNYLPMEDYAQLFGQVTGDMGGLIGQAPVSERAGLLKSLMMMPQMAQAELMGSGYYPQQPTPTGLGYDVMQAPTPMPMGGGGLAGGLDSEALTQIAMGMA